MNYIKAKSYRKSDLHLEVLLYFFNFKKDDKSENIRLQFNLSDEIELIAADFLMSKCRIK